MAWFQVSWRIQQMSEVVEVFHNNFPPVCCNPSGSNSPVTPCWQFVSNCRKFVAVRQNLLIVAPCWQTATFSWQLAAVRKISWKKKLLKKTCKKKKLEKKKLVKKLLLGKEKRKKGKRKKEKKKKEKRKRKKKEIFTLRKRKKEKDKKIDSNQQPEIGFDDELIWIGVVENQIVMWARKWTGIFLMPIAGS